MTSSLFCLSLKLRWLFGKAVFLLLASMFGLLKNQLASSSLFPSQFAFSGNLVEVAEGYFKLLFICFHFLLRFDYKPEKKPNVLIHPLLTTNFKLKIAPTFR